MVYSPSKVVACVKVGGKILREDGSTVTLPFGSEYSVLVKNLNTTRIKVKVSIDGTEATENVWLVVEPNSDLELERFIRNGNLSAGNRFKFIERTESIEQHRGIKADDGLIRIEYQVEKRTVVDAESLSESDNVGFNSFMETSAQSDKGITVAGSESNQRFSWTSGFETGPSEVIVLQLRGEVGGKKAVKAVTVDVKPKCVTCGRVNKATSKFCANCGTALSII